jgi:hypothetical protein
VVVERGDFAFGLRFHCCLRKVGLDLVASPFVLSLSKDNGLTNLRRSWFDKLTTNVRHNDCDRFLTQCSVSTMHGPHRTPVWGR